MEKITKDEWLKRGTALYGDDMFGWKFKCPSCGHIQAVNDFKPYKDKGASPDSARFNCIGRYDGHINTPMGTKPGPCNYTSGGLINISPLIVIDGDKESSSFEFADTKNPELVKP